MHASAADRLLHHYRQHARELPWRSRPGELPTDPYRVWLSEVMLQQTTVAAVAPRYARFLERWPTVEALAAAPEEAVFAEWAGLGYYARARNLHACAREVARLGGFPTTEAELRKLPGVGAYTAAAVAAIAFGADCVAVDTNVERVIARLFALSGKADVPARAAAMLPVGSGGGDFTQALMDLGATICRPKAPDCPSCPLRDGCQAYALGTPEAFPARPIKRQRPHRFGIAWWCRQGDEVRLVRRPARGLLGGMAALPGPEWNEARPAVQPLAAVRHIFTHFSLDLLVVEAAADDGWWQPLDRLDEAGLPTLYRRAVDAALAAERQPRLAA
ncbi:MAG: A/G-specific adenine glycosylase [uncultured Sphingomonas sp.]|uniref:Adenine DNA glycosylase n=1 Tax=uncultured Sphingomonas sp. TaxID=158754 RepID=A0A6J4SWK9_9SPHN|nr:A/G-specific adenine glycosylase [uncultured Sphingomonas sp.]CAA9507408.1 MAG: A/G-specific adenine glycosylase [uncultured Sphingomonas sp.]